MPEQRPPLGSFLPDTVNTYFYFGSFEVGRELQVKLKEVGETDTLAYAPMLTYLSWATLGKL